VIARNVDELHSANNNVTKQTALMKRVNRQRPHGEAQQDDMLTGSRLTARPSGAPFADMTCSNWTKGGTDGGTLVGHFDRCGPIETSWATSWNSSHPTRGCDPEGLKSTGGDGLFYCFAVK
jgi:hypothetical protein